VAMLSRFFRFKENENLVPIRNECGVSAKQHSKRDDSFGDMRD